MKYILIQNNICQGEISNTKDMLAEERSIPGCVIWYMPNNYLLPKPQEGFFTRPDPRPFPNDMALEAIRNKRTALLAECDWTVAVDVPLTATQKTTWKTYRQQLRDLPDAFASNPN